MSQRTPDSRLKLFSFSAGTRALHLNWIAFFISFVVWFNHAPLMGSIRETFDLSTQEVRALLIMNVALAIPARIIIGMLVDKYKPRVVYSGLLFFCSFICFSFALAESYQMLLISRFALGFIGAGFIVGIRMIGEWFPVKQLSVAEGIYAGWGNVGSAAAALLLPTVALLYAGDNGWRYAIATSGAIALVYSVIYYKMARNSPNDSTRITLLKTGAMEVTSRNDVFFYLLMNIPMYASLAVLAWTLGPDNLAVMDSLFVTLACTVLAVLYVYQSYRILRVNAHVLSKKVPEIHQYRFRQVAVLELAYLATFGSELAVISMLPLFFSDTFGLNQVQAGLLASGYAFMNLVARPGGGLISDCFGRKRTLSFLTGGLAIGYFVMSNITSEWPLVLTAAVIIACSFFVQAGEGAVFAIVPLIKRRMTGHIAGMVGAYGNVGAVIFLTVFLFADASTLFLVVSCTAIVTLIAIQFLDEPGGQTAETTTNGSVRIINIS